MSPQLVKLAFNYLKGQPAKWIVMIIFCFFSLFANANANENHYGSCNNKTTGKEIPRIIHHIWLTKNHYSEKICEPVLLANIKNSRLFYPIRKEMSPYEIACFFGKEISEKDMECILKNHNIFSQSSHKWQHIVWTNNKGLIPISVEKLEANGIEVRELTFSELNDNSFYLQQLIDKRLWGIASDILRVILLHRYGGVYADLNFKFSDNAPDILEEIIGKYSFYNADRSENYSFCSVEYSSILGSVLNEMEKQLNNFEPEDDIQFDGINKKQHKMMRQKSSRTNILASLLIKDFLYFKPLPNIEEIKWSDVNSITMAPFVETTSRLTSKCLGIQYGVDGRGGSWIPQI